MIICPRCQAQNPDGSNQCRRCGYPLHQGQISPYYQNMPVQISNYELGTNIDQQYKMFSNKVTHKPEKKTDVLKIALLTVSVLLFFSNIAVIWALIQSRAENQKQKESYVELQKTAFSNLVLGQINPTLDKLDSGSSSPNIASDHVNVAPTLTSTPKAEAQAIHIGDKITLDFVEFSLDSIVWSEKIYPSDTSGYYSYYSAKDDEQYLVLWGTMKNLSGESIRFDQMKVEFEFNEKYKFSGMVEIEDDDKGGFNSIYSIKPLKKSKFIIFASIPNEVISLYDHGILTFGFNDFQHYVSTSKMNELEHIYCLNFSK